MNKEDILKFSRKENKNKDLADLEVSAQAGNIAGRVGASVAIILSLIYIWFTNKYFITPWIIYFSILGTHSLVRYLKLKKNTDLVFAILYYAICIIAFIFFILRLMEVTS